MGSDDDDLGSVFLFIDSKKNILASVHQVIAFVIGKDKILLEILYNDLTKSAGKYFIIINNTS